MLGVEKALKTPEERGIIEVAVDALCRGGGGPADVVVEERVPEALRNTGQDVQRGAGVSLEGKVASVREQQKLLVDSLGRRIARAERQITDAAHRRRWDQVHQKERRLANLKNRLMKLEADLTVGRVRLCFGSKRLWRMQHNLAENGSLQPRGMAGGMTGGAQRRVLRAGEPG